MKNIFFINRWLSVTLGVISMAMAATSCKKFIELPGPSTSVNSDIVYSDDAAAASVMTALYANMSNSSLRSSTGTGFALLNFYPELSADNLVLFDKTNVNYNPYYINDLRSIVFNSSPTVHFWTLMYPYIYRTNAVLEGVASSKTISARVAAQLTGEALFMRAFFHFSLVNLYGPIPLAETADYRVNATLSRSSVEKIYAKIIEDLKTAVTLLDSRYLDGSLSNQSNDRIRPNKAVATALLSRACLYSGDYANAEKYASEVIAQKPTYDTISVDKVFLKNSVETIWALQPVRTSENTPEAQVFMLPAAGPSIGLNLFYLSNNLLQSFEPNDKRRTNWVSSVTVSGGTTYSYVSKYKLLNAAVNEYSILIRLAEMYLIRAEARAQLGTDLTGALEDVNVIRVRSGLPKLNALGKDALLAAILHERQTEFFTEWGHRWFDLKRTGQVDNVMPAATALKGGIWKDSWKLYPIPSSEIVNNPNLTQNPDYPY